MANSYNEYVYNGVTIFNLGFTYLSKEHIFLYVNTKIRPISELRWISDSQVEVLTSSLVPGDIIKVARITPIAWPIVDYQAGSRLNELNLDTSNLQNIYLNQETRDMELGYGADIVENRTAAELAQSKAEDARDLADISASVALAAKTESEASASASNTNASSASGSAILAQRYANEDEDIVIDTIEGVDQYSAYHWVQKLTGIGGIEIGDFVQLVDNGSGQAIVPSSVLGPSIQSDWARVSTSSDIRSILNKPEFDTVVTEDSNNLVSSGLVFDSLATKADTVHNHVQADITDLPVTIIDSGPSDTYLSSDGTYSKPTATNADWTATFGNPGYIGNRPTIPQFLYDGVTTTEILTVNPGVDSTPQAPAKVRKYLDDSGLYTTPPGGAGAEQSDWEAVSGDAEILNRPLVYDGSDVGTRLTGSLVALATGDRLPAMDGSLLTGISGSGTGEITDSLENQIYVNTGQIPVILNVGSGITTGSLVIGSNYEIVSYESGDDFTNVGANYNRPGVVFEATGTTPTDWTNASSLQEFEYVIDNGNLVVEDVNFAVLDLGTESDTAYRGDHGLIAYNHANTIGTGIVDADNPHGLSLADLSTDTSNRVVTDAQIAVWNAKQVAPAPGNAYVEVPSSNVSIIAGTTATYTTALDDKLDSIVSGADITTTSSIRDAGGVLTEVNNRDLINHKYPWDWLEWSGYNYGVGDDLEIPMTEHGDGVLASDYLVPTSRAVASYVQSRLDSVSDTTPGLVRTTTDSTSTVDQLKDLKTLAGSPNVLSSDLVLVESSVPGSIVKAVPVSNLVANATVGSATQATYAGRLEHESDFSITGVVKTTVVSKFDGKDGTSGDTITFNTVYDPSQFSTQFLNSISSTSNIAVTTIPEDGALKLELLSNTSSGGGGTLPELGIIVSATDINNVCTSAGASTQKNSHVHDYLPTSTSFKTVGGQTIIGTGDIPMTGGTSFWSDAGLYYRPLNTTRVRIYDTGDYRYTYNGSDTLPGASAAANPYTVGKADGLNIFSNSTVVGSAGISVHRDVTASLTDSNGNLLPNLGLRSVTQPGAANFITTHERNQVNGIYNTLTSNVVSLTPGSPASIHTSCGIHNRVIKSPNTVNNAFGAWQYLERHPSTNAPLGGLVGEEINLKNIWSSVDASRNKVFHPGISANIYVQEFQYNQATEWTYPVNNAAFTNFTAGMIINAADAYPNAIYGEMDAAILISPETVSAVPIWANGILFARHPNSPDTDYGPISPKHGSCINMYSALPKWGLKFGKVGANGAQLYSALEGLKVNVTGLVSEFTTGGRLVIPDSLSSTLAASDGGGTIKVRGTGANGVTFGFNGALSQFYIYIDGTRFVTLPFN